MSKLHLDKAPEDQGFNISEKNERQIVALLCYMIPFSAMNIVMFNVALPDINADFHVRFGSASWVVTVFGIIYAVGALIYGKLADIYGLKKLVIFGIVMFSVGSIAGLFAFDFSMLLTARILQGIGASSIPSISMLIPVRLVNHERRGRALGMVAATLAFSGAIGPIVGGFIIGTFHWRYLFLFSLGVLLALPFILKWMPDGMQKKPQTVDFMGAGSVIAATVCLMLAVTLPNVWMLLACLCLIPVFLIRQKQAVAPFIPLDLLRSRLYRHGLLMGSFNASINFGVMMITPILFSQVYGLQAKWIGLLLFPGAITSAVLGYFGGRMIDRKGTRFVCTLGVLLIGVGLLLISSLSGYKAWWIAICLMFCNSGYMFMQPALAKWVSGTLSNGETGIGMGVYSLNNFLSTALCGAIVTKALEYMSPVAVNPWAASGNSGVYSNVYFGFFLLALFNVFMVYRFTYNSGHKPM